MWRMSTGFLSGTSKGVIIKLVIKIAHFLHCKPDIKDDIIGAADIT